jgi:hypothetical protein
VHVGHVEAEGRASAGVAVRQELAVGVTFDLEQAAVPVVDLAAAVTKPATKRKPPRPAWLLPALCGIGLLAASIVAAIVVLRPAAKSPYGGKQVDPSADKQTDSGSGSEKTPSEATGHGGPADTAADEPATGKGATKPTVKVNVCGSPIG